MTDPNSVCPMLKLPSTIGIETSSLCNRACVFCPNATHKRDDEFMPEEMFIKILNDLAAVGWAKNLHLYRYNEPMRDKRLLDLIALATATLPGVCVMLNTNGDYFRSKDDIMRFFDKGGRHLQINIYSSDYDSEKAEEAATKRFNVIQGWVNELSETVGIMQGRSLYNYSKERRCNVVWKGELEGFKGTMKLTNRGGILGTIPEPLRKGCTRPFRNMNINWQGDVLLCCQDYHGVVKFGNVMDKSVSELWNSYALNVYRVKLLGKDRRIPVCDQCDYSGGVYQHNVPHVSFGKDEDRKIVEADMRSGFVPLTVSKQ